MFPGRIPISDNYRPLLIQRTVARKGPSVFVNNGRVIGQEGNTHGVLPCSCVTVATAQKHKPKVMYSASRCLRLLRSWSAERKPLFFPPPFPLGGKLIPSGHSEVKQTGALGSVELHCEIHQ